LVEDSPCWTEVEAESTDQLCALAGQLDEHLRTIQRAFGLRLVVRECGISVEAGREGSRAAENVVRRLLAAVRDGHALSGMDVQYAIESVKADRPDNVDALRSPVIWTTARGRSVRARTAGQAAYVEAMAHSDLVFAIGPAGTGKTYLAMAMACAALRAKAVSRLVLTRPIREAGESLGFLPGDIQEKVDPYLRPLYDALYELVGIDRFRRYVERGVIELAPLAYMRGRTLNESFVVLDEAQNTTVMQMKMFLTRLGQGSQMVVTGDTTQIDLPEGGASGLVHARGVLQGLPGIAVCDLTEIDVVRHSLVQRIVRAYDAHERAEGDPAR
jgi:phosphate starvation-inducible PhoH-like protein